jgi:alkylation response protein AidB-like acyl-CoA dehydrogenase
MNFDLNDEQTAWKKSVHDFVGKVVKPKAREVDENEEFNWDAVRKGGPVGLLGLTVSPNVGQVDF